MNAQPAAPFSPFSPSPPPTPMFEGEVTGKKPRKARAKKAAPQLPAGRQVKPRKAKTGTIREEGTVVNPPVPTRRRARKPRPTMIPIGVLPALAGLAEAETSMLMSIIGNMQELPKKSRAKIVAALGKVFA